MTAMAQAIFGAGLVNQAEAEKASGDVRQRQALAELCRKVREALRRGRIAEYTKLRARLPADLRSKY
jgi:hypothetical protein